MTYQSHDSLHALYKIAAKLTAFVTKHVLKAHLSARGLLRSELALVAKQRRAKQNNGDAYSPETIHHVALRKADVISVERIIAG